MFGALNRFIGRLDSDPNATARSHFSGDPNSSGGGGGGATATTGYGFQVLRNTNPSLALEPWFDFIIGINGHNIDNPDPTLFQTELRNCAGSTISLGVYGAKGREIRETYITVPPDVASAGGGGGATLGLALQWTPLSVADDVWHILDVMPHAPADAAGLLPYSDYVIGTPEAEGAKLRHGGDAALGELVEAFLDRPLRLYVYNQEYDVTRVVTLTPTRQWGGEGALGCVLGYGALHRIPAPLGEPAQAPGETLFEASTAGDGNVGTGVQNGQALETAPLLSPEDQQSAAYLVPANLEFANKSGPSSPLSGAGPPPAAGRAKKGRAHHNTAPVAGLDDYFAEGEQKSRELDNAPKSKAGGGLPPPPKAGGPPKATSPAPEAES